MKSKQAKTLTDYLLETYQKTGLSRRRFLRRIGLSITGAGALIAALAKTARGCGCGSCNTGCNVGCNAACDVHTCDEYNICPEKNNCATDNTCLKEHTCSYENTCGRRNTCQKTDICTTDTCGTNACKYMYDTCEVNSCTINSCYINICTKDDWCAINGCEYEDTHCSESDIIYCGINWIGPQA